MHRSLAFLAILFASGVPLPAQAPRAEPVDPELRPDPGQDLFQRGKNLHDMAAAANDVQNRIEMFGRAAEVLEGYLREFGNHRNAEAAWWYLADCYYLGGRMEDGLRCFHTLINRYGKGQWVGYAAFTLAAEQYNRTEYALAAPLFERAANNVPKADYRVRSRYYQASCLRLSGNDRAAIAAYQQVLDDPQGALFAAQARVGLGHIAVKAGKHADALAHFVAVADSQAIPKHRGEAALGAGLTATKLGQPDTADKYLRMVLTTPGMEEHRTDAQTALMANLYARKDYGGVTKAYQDTPVKAVGEKEADRLMIVARSWMKLKRPADALAMFREVERLVKPEDDRAFEASYFRLLCFYQIEGRHVAEQVDAFLKLYRRGRPDDSRIHTALLMKAETLFASKDTAAAAKAYAEINADRINGPNRAGLFYQRGWCLAEAGDQQGAIRSLSEFIDRYPNDSRVPSALAKRASAYAAAAESEKAIKDFDRLTAAGMPKDLIGYAWLESARLRRTDGNVADMIARYKSWLEKVNDPNPKLQGEANFWIGQGLTKSSQAKEAVPFLTKARELRPENYGKHAGLLLVHGYYFAQDSPKLDAEIEIAIRSGYEGDIPEQILQWAGMQAFNAEHYGHAARFLALIANPDEPRETPKEVWRYLAKSRLETGEPQDALAAAANVLAVEENSGWKADAMLDRGRAFAALDRLKDARAAVDDAFALRPQGRTKAGLLILSGELKELAGDLKGAAAEFTIVVEFHDDNDLKPRALQRLIEVLDKQGDRAAAEKYRAQLAKDFPDWKPVKPLSAPKSAASPGSADGSR